MNYVIVLNSMEVIDVDGEQFVIEIEMVYRLNIGR